MKKENSIKNYFCGSFGNKGISSIVATVLIILITITTVTVIWAMIIPLVSNQLDEGTICLDAIQQLTIPSGEGFTCKNSTGINVQVSQGSKDIQLKDIQILIYAGGNSETFNVLTINPLATLPTFNGEKIFTIPFSEISNFNNVDRISIAPIISIGNTAKICEATTPINLLNCN